MADMFVHLLTLPPVAPLIERLREQNILIRRGNPWELTRTREFAMQFGLNWADEVTISYSRQPPTIFIAALDGEICGFCCYESCCRNFLGPIGVSEAVRGKDIGTALLLASLAAMREMGYAYAIIGGVGPADFYRKTCGAELIPDSTPGIYANQLKKRS